MAQPNWNPWVHSVQPRLVYLPFAVNTGDPCSGRQALSRERILSPDNSKRRLSLGTSAAGAGAFLVSTIPADCSSRSRLLKNRDACPFDRAKFFDHRGLAGNPQASANRRGLGK